MHCARARWCCCRCVRSRLESKGGHPGPVRSRDAQSTSRAVGTHLPQKPLPIGPSVPQVPPATPVFGLRGSRQTHYFCPSTPCSSGHLAGPSTKRTEPKTLPDILAMDSNEPDSARPAKRKRLNFACNYCTSSQWRCAKPGLTPSLHSLRQVEKSPVRPAAAIMPRLPRRRRRVHHDRQTAARAGGAPQTRRVAGPGTQSQTGTRLVSATRTTARRCSAWDSPFHTGLGIGDESEPFHVGHRCGSTT